MHQKILVIDDAEAIHSLLKARLQSEPVDLYFASEGEVGIAKAVELNPDLILLDVDMPAPDGFEVCRRLKDDPRTMTIPIVFLTASASTEQKIRGLDLGAIDYITKPFDPAELRARVRASLRTKYLMDLLAHKAMIDGLTGLWNRDYFESRLASELSLRRRITQPLSCILLDLDHFKEVNDRYGHPVGDDLLRLVGRLLCDRVRSEDVVCRYGGEEFVILVPGTSADGAAKLAEAIRVAVQDLKWVVNGREIAVTCSLGVSDLHRAPPPTIVELADAALYQAKNNGRNRVAVADRVDTGATAA